MDRGEILENAYRHTVGSRDKEYGNPQKTLGDIAVLWSAYIQQKYGLLDYISAEDVAHLNQLQKIARTFNGPTKADTYEDNAAYAAIAGECAMAQARYYEKEMPESPEVDVPAFIRQRKGE